MRYYVIVISFLFLSCRGKDKYDVSLYYNKSNQDSVLANIVTYIFIAPPYTSMPDRFKSEHKEFYTDSTLLAKFSVLKYYICDDGTNYFLVLRPGNRVGEKRAVGGYFKRNKDQSLVNFHEVFVTPLLSEESAREKGGFLFDKMVQGEVQEYLKMKSYVQWPNDASYYDTLQYEWKLRL